MLIALHLIPGALVTVAFVLLAPLVKAAGFPPITALLAAILLVLVPVELANVLPAIRRDGGTAAVPYRQRLGLREWSWLVPVLIVAAFVGFGVHRLTNRALAHRAFRMAARVVCLPSPSRWHQGLFRFVVNCHPLARVSAFRLAEVTSGRVATILTGAFHGISHLPLLLLTTTYQSAGQRWIVVRW